MKRTTSGVFLDATPSVTLAPAHGTKKNKHDKMKRGRQTQAERRAKESLDVTQMGVTQMASLVVSHLFAPLWSIGMSATELESRKCMVQVDWESSRIKNFVHTLDNDFDESKDHLVACYKKMHSTLESDPEYVTAFIVLNIARLEMIEMTKQEVKNGRVYSTLLEYEQQRCRNNRKADRNQTMWNDECSGGHGQRSLTEMGGEAVERIGERSKASFLNEGLAMTRRQLLQILLLTSCFCKYNFRDDNMYHVCNQLCTQMFLISPSEVLSTLVCGEKGPVYVSKYLRFLMVSTGSLLVETDNFLPGKVSRSAALGVPQAVQNAWLPIFTSLTQLTHSNNHKAGQNICGAFTVALRLQLTKIDILEKKIEDLEAISRDREQTALIEKKAAAEAKSSERGMGAKVIDVVRKIPGDLLQAPKMLVEGNSKREDDKDRKLKHSQSVAALRDKITALKRPLPTLLGLIRILLARISCHGDDGPRAWGELIESVRLLQIYPNRTGLLAVDIMRAAAAAVQCMDCLLRHRLSKCFVGGGEMASFKRERAFLLCNPHAQRCKVLCKVYLGFIPRAMKKSEADPRITAQMDNNNWTDDVLAPSSLCLNILLKIARHEESKKLDEGFLGHSDMINNLRQLPPSVVAQYYPELFRLMRGPIGGVGHLMTFSEGAGKGLKVVPSLYESLLKLYRQMVDQSGHKSHEEMLHLHIPSPVDPALHVIPKMLSAKIDIDEPGTEWASLLVSLIREEQRYYKEEEDYWGDTTPQLEPFDLKLVLGGGSGTVHHFCNGLAKLSSGGALHKLPIFKVFPLPLGGENLLCGWLEKQDAVYQQLISWPLQQAAMDDNLSRLSDFDFDQMLTSHWKSSNPETLESGMLRSALNTYLVDADKASKVYVYKLEAWKGKGAPGNACDLTIAWCQQVEFGPASDAPRAGGAGFSEPTKAASLYLPPSPMTTSFDQRNDEFLTSPVSVADRSLRPGISPHRSMRGNSVLGRTRTGSNILPAPRVDLSPGQSLTMEELYNALREAPAFQATDNLDYSKTASGEAIASWLSESYQLSHADAIRVCNSMVDFQIIAPSTNVGKANASLHGLPSPSLGFKESNSYKLGILAPQHRINKGEGAAPTRRLTVVTEEPQAVEIQNIALSGGQDYPDLRPGKDMFIHKISMRNVGKEGDQGLYPDPTEPAIQVYILGHKDRKKAMSAPWNKGGEGAHYSILGQLSVSSKEEGRPFCVLVDGTPYGPFEKITVSPWLDVDKSRRSAVKRHLSFNVMGFTPTNTE